MVQEFTGFPAPPFAAAPPPAVRPRLLGGPPFLMRPSPLKYPQSSMLLPPISSCTATLANTAINTAAAASNNNNNITTTSTSSLVDALALFAKSNVGAGASAMPGGSGAAAADHHYHGIGMGGFNPFDDFQAPAATERESVNGGAGHGFFSSFVPGDKYGGRH
ncbi:hypothetical protein PR202_gn00047 [Eleusine coracana subsp. coracana]|nr:hypothetical protein PR202_gn00047 [Eleusine coracana subsp. coracana]